MAYYENTKRNNKLSQDQRFECTQTNHIENSSLPEFFKTNFSKEKKYFLQKTY